MIVFTAAHVRLVVIMALPLASFFLVVMAGAEMEALLEFQRHAIGQGEVWRLFTANLTHFGNYHALMNAAGFAALVAVLFWYLPVNWLLVGVIFVPLLVGMCLYFFAGDVEVYRGFSGANYGLLAMGLLLILPQQRRLYALAYVVLLGKIIYEQMPGYDVDYLREEIGVPVAIEAHLAGFCSGTFVGVVGLVGSWLMQRRRSTSAAQQQ